MPIQMIAMDMDGTLLSPDANGRHHIASACVQALRMAHEHGIHLALASGRMPEDAGYFALDAGLPMHILALNGGCCQMEPMGAITFFHSFPVETALRLYALLREAGVLYGIFGTEELVISCPAMSQEEIAGHWGTNLIRQGVHTVIRIAGDGAEALCRTGVCKMLAIDEEGASVLQPLRERIEAECLDVEVSSSWRNNLELNPRGVHKGLGLCELASSLHIPLANVMALGDHDNDLPMLRRVGWSVAMGNATPSVLSAARYVTANNLENGVAEAIYGLALGERGRKVRCVC